MSADEMVERAGKIIDPEAWGLPPTIEIENDYHDRETARDKARGVIALVDRQPEIDRLRASLLSLRDEAVWMMGQLKQYGQTSKQSETSIAEATAALGD